MATLILRTDTFIAKRAQKASGVHVGSPTNIHFSMLAVFHMDRIGVSPISVIPLAYVFVCEISMAASASRMLRASYPYSCIDVHDYPKRVQCTYWYL